MGDFGLVSGLVVTVSVLLCFQGTEAMQGTVTSNTMIADTMFNLDVSFTAPTGIYFDPLSVWGVKLLGPFTLNVASSLDTLAVGKIYGFNTWVIQPTVTVSSGTTGDNQLRIDAIGECKQGTTCSFRVYNVGKLPSTQGSFEFVAATYPQGTTDIFSATPSHVIGLGETLQGTYVSTIPANMSGRFHILNPTTGETSDIVVDIVPSVDIAHNDIIQITFQDGFTIGPGPDRTISAVILNGNLRTPREITWSDDNEDKYLALTDFIDSSAFGTCSRGLPCRIVVKDAIGAVAAGSSLYTTYSYFQVKVWPASAAKTTPAYTGAPIQATSNFDKMIGTSGLSSARVVSTEDIQSLGAGLKVYITQTGAAFPVNQYLVVRFPDAFELSESAADNLSVYGVGSTWNRASQVTVSNTPGNKYISLTNFDAPCPTGEECGVGIGAFFTNPRWGTYYFAVTAYSVSDFLTTPTWGAPEVPMVITVEDDDDEYRRVTLSPLAGTGIILVVFAAGGCMVMGLMSLRHVLQMDI